MYGPHHIFIMPRGLELNLSRMVHDCRWLQCSATEYIHIS
ncbi:hypothetical protein ID866_13288 [Astraeus odoratus]|nr:hypothetical protein ID866_13288 [Astraeus odoratus]